MNHEISLNCDRWTFANMDLIPTGSIRGVGGTIMDLRIPKILGNYIEKVLYSCKQNIELRIISSVKFSK